MIFNFEPWRLDIDVDATRRLYAQSDYSTDKAANEEFVAMLSEKQLHFFDSLGVDPMRIEVDRKHCYLSQDEDGQMSKRCLMLVHFLMRGRMLALTQFQKGLYAGEDLFGKDFPESIAVGAPDADAFETFDIGIGSGVVFKHPVLHYDDDIFQTWDCGYVLGAIMIGYVAETLTAPYQ